MLLQSRQREGKPRQPRSLMCAPFRYNPDHSNATQLCGEFLA